MLVFIDESGCPSFSLGGSEYFTIAMVIFLDSKQAELVSSIINDVRISTGFRREFKFNSTKVHIKDAFFTAVASSDFIIKSICIKKSDITSPHLKNKFKDFYRFTLKHLITSRGIAIQNANIKIDGSGGKQFKKQSVSYLRKELPAGTLDRVTFKDSKNNNLIQLADMVVGLIAKSHAEPANADVLRWKKTISDKILNDWRFK